MFRFMKYLCPSMTSIFFIGTLAMNGTLEWCAVNRTEAGSSNETLGIGCFANSMIFETIMFLVVGSLNNASAVGERIDEILFGERTLKGEIKSLFKTIKTHKAGTAVACLAAMALILYAECDSVTTAIDLERVCESDLFAKKSVQNVVQGLVLANDTCVGSLGLSEAWGKVASLFKRPVSDVLPTTRTDIAENDVTSATPLLNHTVTSR